MNHGKRNLSKDHSVHVTDEKINTASHLTGAVFSLLGTVLLVVQSVQAADIWKVISFSVYGGSLFLLFLFSTFHHGISAGEGWDRIFRLFDYCAVFLLIAGTFTPICLVLSRNTWGWSVLGVVWLVAIAGITVKSVFPDLPKWVSTTLYVSMGWIGGILCVRLFSAIGISGAALIIVGGVFYTVGVIIYSREKPNPVPGKFGFHEIWHLFVLAGALIHYLFMYLMVLKG
jgi:hemolysin III